MGAGAEAAAALDLNQKADAFYVSAVRSLHLDPAFEGVLSPLGQAAFDAGVNAITSYAEGEIDAIAAEAMDLLKSLSPEVAEIAGTIASDVAGAIPIVGTVVEIAKLVFDIVSASNSATDSQNGRWCSPYRAVPVTPTGEYDPQAQQNTIQPIDIFRIAPNPGQADAAPLAPGTTLGRVLVALTEGDVTPGANVSDSPLYHGGIAWHNANAWFLNDWPTIAADRQKEGAHLAELRRRGQNVKVLYAFGVPAPMRAKMQALRLAVASGGKASRAAFIMYCDALSYCWHNYLGGVKYGPIFGNWWLSHIYIAPGDSSVMNTATRGWQVDDTWTSNGGGLAAGAADGAARTACAGVEGQWIGQLLAVAKFVANWDATRAKIGPEVAAQIHLKMATKQAAPKPRFVLHLPPKKRVNLRGLVPVLRPNLSTVLVRPTAPTLWDRVVRWWRELAK